MKDIYTCKECGVEFNVHGNAMPWQMRDHYRANHPELYLQLAKREGQLKEQRKQLGQDFPHCSCIFI